MPSEGDSSVTVNLNQEELKQLNHKRGQIKAKLTRFKNFLDSLPAEGNLKQLKLRLATIQTCLSEFEDIQIQIELLDTTDLPSTERETFESLYFDLTAKAEEYIESQSPLPPQHIPQPISDNNTASSTVITPLVRLPSIDLPSFSGKYEDWIPFADSFKALIHHNETLTDIQRLHYLKSSLKDEAAQVLTSLELTASNYSVGWNLLQERFQNRRLIIDRHVKALHELPQIERESATSLRQLLDGTLMHMRALKALHEPTEHWDTLIRYLVTSKLNQGTNREWENSTNPDEIPTLKQLTDFLQRKCQVLESSTQPTRHKSTLPISSIRNSYPKNRQACLVAQTYTTCRVCKEKHYITQCPKLINCSTYDEQIQLLKTAGLCFNCLRPGHTVTQCRSGSCRKCPSKHNTLLHQTHLKAKGTKQSSSTDQAKQTEGSLQNCHSTAHLTQVVLSTAVVDVIGPNGQNTKCRALIDNGSQSCFMTENIAQILSLRRSKQVTNVNGIDQCKVKINGAAQATLRSCVTNYSVSLSFLVVPRITGQLPTHKLNVEEFKVPKHITLADPSFHSPSRIDLLLGQEIFLDLLCIGQIRAAGMPTLQKTRLGWIVGGRHKTTEATSNSVCHLSTVNQRIDQQLQAFWKLEEPSSKNHLTSDERSCEAHYISHTRRDSNGRYVVSMPLKEPPCQLGESREIAVKRFEQVERRLNKNPELSKQYKLFMKEYLELGHMEEVKTQLHCNTTVKSPEYFLPHHPVIKENSSTTKLRVVFDASAKTSSGKSLNDIQFIGPAVQSDLSSILLNFRMFTFVMTADLEKMFRQIEIEPSQRNLLQIVWREDTSLPMKTFRLNTVTYGTASAPYLATRTLNQLASDEESNFPKAAEVIRRDFYVDGLLTGSHTIQEGLSLQKELIEMLGRGHFNLRKWNSNCNELLYSLPEHMRERQPQQFVGAEDSSLKTLGLWWDAEVDAFQFRYTPVQRKHSMHLSKRIVLSDIARLFDPLGLIAPVIVRPKLILQELWKLKLDWDESLPMSIHTRWMSIQRCLQELGDLRIPRQVTHPSLGGSLQIHGFADSSERAYGAAVYLRHEDADGRVKTSLLSSKSRVAPLHSTSLPRLELCAALLLTEVVAQIQNALHISPEETTFWTDSTVTLAWIRGEPARWVTFVANRVAKIQEATKNSTWRHVNTHYNPADLVSRGETARNLTTSELWWHGPSWLSQPQELWPENTPDVKDVPEERRATITLVSTQETRHVVHELITRNSSFEKLTRILSYVQRFILNSKRNKTDRVTGALTTEELARSRTTVLKVAQQEFCSELKELKSGRLTTKNKLLSLSPFLDQNGVIRVGGRLDQSKLSYDIKHPVLLPKGHRITEMIASQEHVRNLHCGPQALLCAIRLRYWPINGRDIARKVTYQCLKCFRARPKTLQQKMGDLPASRVTPAQPFSHTGIDFCGPFFVKPSRQRGAKTTKAYVAVFVCFSTKAIHLELVSDLTTDTFMGALRRFISRRGICTEIMSDNGKTFVGAKRELHELHTFLKNESHNIISESAKEGIKWSFNPPYAPHMGGLWEAAVKSFKHHLYRIVGTASLTYEELNTTLTQIEAVLNSRPLTALSNDPSDLSALTPSHFLIGSSLKALPEPSIKHLPENRLNRWQRVQQLVQHFWSRWATEYLTTLQQRSKWKTASPSLQVGALVLLKEDNRPPLSWPMGRVIALHPGKDNLVRVASVKTSSGEVRRSIHKLFPLPMDQ